MSTIQQALKDVGYKPTAVRLRTLRRAAEREATITLEAFVDGVVERLTKPRKIQVTKAGTHRKARYQGMADFVFCDEETSFAQVQRRLKFFCSGQEVG